MDSSSIPPSYHRAVTNPVAPGWTRERMKSTKSEGVLVGAWHLRPIRARETEYTVRPKPMSPTAMT
jgi:hypothetical protein